MNRKNTLSDTRNLVLCGMCAAITCILAPLSVPLAGGVPVSLATFAVMLAGVLQPAATQKEPQRFSS